MPYRYKCNYTTVGHNKANFLRSYTPRHSKYRARCLILPQLIVLTSKSDMFTLLGWI